MNLTSYTRPTRWRGFSLVEMMVAIGLGSILMIGVITLFVSSRANYRYNTQIAQVQDTSRFALDTVLADLRMAGFFGCGGSSVTIDNITGTAGATPAVTDINSTANRIEGIDDANTTWSPSGGVLTNTGTAPLGAIVRMPGSDAIAIRRMVGLRAGNIGVNATGTQLTFQSAEFSDVADDFTDFGSAAIANCNRVDVFRVSSKDTATKVVTAANALTKPYEHIDNQITTVAAPFIARRYFVGISDKPAVSSPRTPAKDFPGDWIPILYRTEYRAGIEQPPEEMFTGVEDLQLQYGLDTDGDGDPERYRTAGHGDLDSADEWAQVVTVRMAMLVRSLEPVAGSMKQDFLLLGKAVSATDNYRRRVFSATATLRNL